MFDESNPAGQYILQGHDPVPCPDTLIWGEWMSSADRLVAQTDVRGVLVSTLFLGLDFGSAIFGVAPVVFETVAITKAESLIVPVRYTTWTEAEIGHALVVVKFRNLLPA